MKLKLFKKQLRKILLDRLRKQTQQDREYKSKIIEQKLFEQEEFKKSRRIMFYLAFDGEVITENMINMARDLHKQIYVPVCDTENEILKPCFLEKDAVLEKGAYNILEPKNKSNFFSDKLDLVVVPVVGVDKDGNRLGRGKGYYDRFLNSLSYSTFSIGLAFDFQLVSDLPFNQKDIPLNKVLFA